MNDTVINTNVVSRLKQLVQDIEDLQAYNIGLSFEQEVELAKMQIEVNKIIKEL